eukprot:3554777-Pyramimonas_sp.AAC.1
MAGAGVGPKRRKFGHISAYTPSMEEWIEDLAMPSSKGGMSAREISAEAFLKGASRHDSEFPPSLDHIERATADLERVSEGFRTSARRRAAVPWSLPNEVWALLLSQRPE